MSFYLDASAAVKLLVDEPESDPLAVALDALPEDVDLVSCALLETELRRFATREEVSQAAVSDLLDRVSLAEPELAVFRAAGLLPGQALRSLDAVHIATALRVQSSHVIAYDSRLLSAARDVGLRTQSPV